MPYTHSMPPVVNLARTTVVSGDLKFNAARFVFHNKRAAVWVEDRSTHTARRVLYAQNAEFIRPQSSRHPMRLVYGDGEWTIRAQGGCGCNSPLKRFTFAQLLDPDINEIE